MTPYQRGAAFERKVRDELQESDWLVVRSPGSKSPYDLVAIRFDTHHMRHEVALIQCRSRGAMTAQEVEVLKDVAEGIAAAPVLAFRLKDGKFVHYRDVALHKDWHP